MKKNLKNVDGSMTKVLSENMFLWGDAVSSVNDVYNAVKKLFEENEINTVASNRLLENIKKNTRLERAVETVQNSMFEGMRMGMNAGKRGY